MPERHHEYHESRDPCDQKHRTQPASPGDGVPNTTTATGWTKTWLLHYIKIFPSFWSEKSMCFDWFFSRILMHIFHVHYIDVIMSTMASQITSLTIVYSTVYSGANQREYQSSVSLAFVRGIHQWPVNSSHKGPVTWKMFPFDDVIMESRYTGSSVSIPIKVT